MARLLAERGHDVVGVVRRRDQVARLAAGVRPAIADVGDARALDAAVTERDVLIHVAGILLAPYVARLLERREPSDVVIVSSAAIRSRHRAAAAEYRGGEDAIRRVRPDAVIVRPTMIYGSRRDRNVHLVIDVARRWRALPLIGGGRGLIQPIHYEDLALAIVELIGARPEAPVDAGGAAALTVRAAGETIFAALGLRPRFVHVPAAFAFGVARILDGARYGRWSERVARMSEDRTADNSALTSLTPVRPRDFRAGVTRQVAEMRSA